MLVVSGLERCPSYGMSVLRGFTVIIYGNPEKKMLNGKKSSLFAKNEKVFVLLI